jgi:DNA-binding response OmpR family regulator
MPAAFFADMERRRPDVVVLNMQVGPDDGIHLLRRIKAMRTGTPVFMLSDTPDVDATVLAMNAGATDVISKPIDTEHLVRAVCDALRRDVHMGVLQGGGARWRCALCPTHAP